MLQTATAEKADEKNGVICLVSLFLSSVMVLEFSKKAYFLQFCADLSKKPVSVKAIYIYAPASSRCTLLENHMAHRVLSHQYIMRY